MKLWKRLSNIEALYHFADAKVPSYNFLQYRGYLRSDLEHYSVLYSLYVHTLLEFVHVRVLYFVKRKRHG